MISLQNLLQQLNGNKLKTFATLLVITCITYGCITTKSNHKGPYTPHKPLDKVKEQPEPDKKVDSSNITHDNIKEEDITNKYGGKEKLEESGVDLQDKNTILLLLPFNTHKIDIKKLDDVNQLKDNIISIDFYRGFKLALDNTPGRQDLKVKVYDTNEDAEKIKSILSPKQLKDTKIIIGPLYPHEIEDALSILNKKNSSNYIISPLAGKLTDTPDYKKFIMINPPIYVHAEKLAEFAINRYQPKHIYYISIQDKKEDDGENEAFIHTFINHMITTSPNTIIENIPIKSDDITKNLELITKTFKNNKETILFVPYNNIDDWYIIMRTLNTIDPTIKLVILAHPYLTHFYRKLDMVKLQQYNTYTTSASFIDIDNSRVVDFFNDYRQLYSTIATKYALSGYDIGRYLIQISNMKNSDELINYKYNGILNNIHLQQSDNSIINQSLKILNITTKGPMVFESY